MMKSKKVVSLLLTFSLLFTLFCTVSVITGSAASIYNSDFGAEGYQGNNTDGEKTDFMTDKAYGTDYVLNTSIKVSSIKDGDGRGVKFILRNCSVASNGKLELWLGKNAIWACTNSWKNMQSFNFVPFMNKDTAVKIMLIGNEIKLFFDGTMVWSCTDSSFAGTETQLAMGGWDAKYVIKSVEMNSIGGAESNLPEGVLYLNKFNDTGYQGMNTDSDAVAFETDKTYGTNYVIDAKINVAAIKDGDGRGIKFVLRKCSAASSGDLELWIGKKAIWACAKQWVNMQDFDISPYMNKEVAFKITVNNNMISLSLDGKEVWSAEDAGFDGTEAKILVGGWDAKYAINEFKLSSVTAPTPDPEPTPTPDPTPDDGSQLPDGVLYLNNFNNTGYQGMNVESETVAFETDKAYGTDYAVEAKINVSSIKDGDGRGIKFVLRKCSAASSGDLELWIGKKAIWACAKQWVNMQDFDFTPYLNKETVFKITISGNDIKVSLDGKEVWTANDNSFSGAESRLIIGGWDAKYVINQVKMSKLGSDSNTGGNGTANSNTGTKLPTGVLYYNDFGGKGFQGMNTLGEKTEFTVDKSYGTDYILETTIHLNSIDDGDGHGIKFVLRDCKAASSGKLELWVGKKAIWACTKQWVNMQDFNITPYLNKDVKVRISVKGSTISLNLDGKEVWNCTDDSFAGCTASPVGLGSWGASYVINSIKITDVNLPSTGDNTPLAMLFVLVTVSAIGLVSSKKLLTR